MVYPFEKRWVAPNCSASSEHILIVLFISLCRMKVRLSNMFLRDQYFISRGVAVVACRVHDPEVMGSNPISATNCRWQYTCRYADDVDNLYCSTTNVLA